MQCALLQSARAMARQKNLDVSQIPDCAPDFMAICTADGCHRFGIVPEGRVRPVADLEVGQSDRFALRMERRYAQF